MESKSPKITIITINYNNLDGLKRTFTSVFNQTWKEFEYVVIDGGSTDGSKELLEQYHDKIDYWVSESDKGIYNAMNKGIKKAKGEYLLFLNSGDNLINDKILEEHHNFIKEKDLIYFNLEIARNTFSQVRTYPEYINFSFMFSAGLPHQATFIKAHLFNELGKYDENLKFSSDWKFFMLCLFKLNCSYLKVDTTLSTFYLDGISSDSKNLKILNEERNQVMNSYFKCFVEDMIELVALKLLVSNLKKSRKIGLLVKLGLINKF
jgi:glycosyltransferase involved in cell wall biosynthesis